MLNLTAYFKSFSFKCKTFSSKLPIKQSYATKYSTIDFLLVLHCLCIFITCNIVENMHVFFQETNNTRKVKIKYKLLNTSHRNDGLWRCLLVSHLTELKPQFSGNRSQKLTPTGYLLSVCTQLGPHTLLTPTDTHKHTKPTDDLLVMGSCWRREIPSFPYVTTSWFPIL